MKDLQWTVRTADTVVLNGTKLFIPDANVADRMLVAARTGDGFFNDPSQGISLPSGREIVAVDTRSPGVSVRVQTGWIGPKVCEVNFENVEAPVSDILGYPEGGAWPALETAMDRGHGSPVRLHGGRIAPGHRHGIVLGSTARPA